MGKEKKIVITDEDIYQISLIQIDKDDNLRDLNEQYDKALEYLKSAENALLDHAKEWHPRIRLYDINSNLGGPNFSPYTGRRIVDKIVLNDETKEKN